MTVEGINRTAQNPDALHNPNMQIHSHIKQGTLDWFEIKRGLITASEVGPFVTNSGKVAEKARLKLICKKLGERAGHIEQVPPNDAMKRGTALEPFAREAYQRITGQQVTEVGFVSHANLPLGCSPDGLIYDGERIARGVEIKCAGASTHIGWLLADELPEEYAYQVHMSMILAQVDHWDFFAYCPTATFIKTRDAWTVDTIEEGAIPPFMKRVYRNALTEELERGLRDLCGEYAAKRATMADLYDRYQHQAAAA
ncbi:MAG: YqaJ viral recombinase family protein [Acidobacteriales bacterium]|nr:YqaJ viral recombinase family protein [Terriglobales bacterium]